MVDSAGVIGNTAPEWDCLPPNCIDRSATLVPNTVVERLVRDEGVAGSNPATPTK